MSQNDVAIVDYGVGNLLSVARGLEHCGARAIVTSDPEQILSASRVLLPGVGAFSVAMQELTSRGLDQVVTEFVQRGNPLLGICLGMQMMLDVSLEFGTSQGLGIIPGQVIPVPTHTDDQKLQKIPHIGWASLLRPEGRSDWNNTILEQMKEGDAVYFVHSFMAAPVDPAHVIAHCLYGGAPVSAVVAKDNVMGCQFHPEKSGRAGLKVLSQFMSM